MPQNPDSLAVQSAKRIRVFETTRAYDPRVKILESKLKGIFR